MRARSRRCASTPAGPGEEFLVDQIPAQRGVIRVQPAQEQADVALRIAHARLERLGNLVEQQTPPRVLGRDGLDPAVAEEYPQPRVAGQRIEDGRRIKAGHAPSVGQAPASGHAVVAPGEDFSGRSSR
jgi:hypothetical protein